MQQFLNKQFYYLYIFTLVFGIILYNPLDITSTDEISALLLLVLFLYSVFNSKNWNFNKAFLFTIGIFLFYTGYSLYINSNVKRAIITDLIIQMKPYVAFFAVYHMKPTFDEKQKKLLQQICLVLWFLLIPLCFFKIMDPLIIRTIMGHPTYFAAGIVAISLTYLFCSEYTPKDKIIFLIMLSAGLASGRSKFYGFYALAAVVILYFGNVANIKLSFKNILIMLATLAVILYVAWEKLQLYFIQGITGEVEEDLIARFVLYKYSIDIFRDYFPFGSGLASYATHASGAYYSHTYVEYGIENVWGMSRKGWDFVADTYYPSLAQFGVAGIGLYILFWVYIIKKAFIYFLKSRNAKYITLAILIIGFITIENIADASITSNRGYFMLLLLGLIMAEQNNAENDRNLIKTDTQ